MDINLVRTYLLVFLVFAEDIHVFNCRSEAMSAFKVPVKNNYFVVATIIISLVVQTGIVYMPNLREFFALQQIPFIHILALLLLTIPLVIIMELFKKIEVKSKVKV